MCTFGIRAAGTNCPQHCTIHFVGIGGDQACQIDLAKSTLLNGEKLVLRNCVDNADSSKTVCIVNTGLCPTTAAVSWQRVDPQWIVDAPSTANIQPGASQCFTVRFAPTAANVWLPKGRGNQPAITDFSNTLVVSGCTSQPYPITGHPDTNCGKNLDDCLQDYNLIHEAIDLNLNKSLGKNDTTLAGAVFYVTAITGPGGTATLSSGGSNPPTTQFAFFDKIDNNKTITEICDPTVRANYLSSIPTHSAAAYLPSVSVGIGDVIAFSLYYGGTYCYGLMWVKDINWDRDPSLPGRQLQVCFQFCYPIKCD
jgi:hypothetical protein